MRYRLVHILLWLQLLAVPACAQLKFGIKGGADLVEMSFSRDVLRSSNCSGFFIGPMAKFGLPVVGLGMDISALYSQRNFNSNGETVPLSDTGESATSESVVLTESWSCTQRQVIFPVNVRYSVGLGSMANIFAFAGPQFGLHLGNDVKHILDDIGEWRLRDAQFSVNVGGGFTVSHLQATVNYNVGVGKTGEVTFRDATDAAFSSRARSWQISFAYFF